tara:strand:+ start:2524 stop:3408 length:885 start_codon:yes stop_codon:yes gene_type:complete
MYKFKLHTIKREYKNNLQITNTINENYNNKIPAIINKQPLVLILRGHIRDSFDDNRLYNFIVYLKQKFKLYIFIHTWNVKSNNISWRTIKKDNTIVDERVIIDYFKNIDIAKIIIDNDATNLKINGIVEGNIKTTLMPIKGWKNMWYGLNRLCEYILSNLKNINLNENTYTLNTRFDYFTNSTITQYVKKPTNYNFMNKIFNFSSETLMFLHNPPHFYGIDNLYFGKFYKMFYTVTLFHTNLDSIIDCYDYIHAQEKLVYLIQPYINTYCDNSIYDKDRVIKTIEFVLIKMNDK